MCALSYSAVLFGFIPSCSSPIFSVVMLAMTHRPMTHQRQRESDASPAAEARRDCTRLTLWQLFPTYHKLQVTLKRAISRKLSVCEVQNLKQVWAGVKLKPFVKMDYASQSKNIARFIKSNEKVLIWIEQYYDSLLVIASSSGCLKQNLKFSFMRFKYFWILISLLPIGVITMETFVALSICPNFQATTLSEPNTNITVLQNTAIKTNFQMTPWVKVNPGFNRVYERFPQKRNV